MTREQIWAAVHDERARQAQKWTRPHHWGYGDCSANIPQVVKSAVLTEECGEVARAVLNQSSDDDLRAELVQVAAVAVAWLESL